MEENCCKTCGGDAADPTQPPPCKGDCRKCPCEGKGEQCELKNKRYTCVGKLSILS